MATKKIRKGGARGKGGADLAEMLSAVMGHPEMPVDLYNHIGDWLASQPQERLDAPAYIRRALSFAKKGGPGRGK